MIKTKFQSCQNGCHNLQKKLLEKYPLHLSIDNFSSFFSSDFLMRNSPYTNSKFLIPPWIIPGYGSHFDIFGIFKTTHKVPILPNTYISWYVCMKVLAKKCTKTGKTHSYQVWCTQLMEIEKTIIESLTQKIIIMCYPIQATFLGAREHGHFPIW